MERPTTNPEAREKLREKGQFMTPEWVADAMAEFVLGASPDVVFEPGVGAGAFFLALKRRSKSRKNSVRMAGIELDPEILQVAKKMGLDDNDLRDVMIGDFMTMDADTTFPGVIANPPYIRHHRLSKEYKEMLNNTALTITGVNIDKRAGIHIFFLIKSLSMLSKGGRLSFIVPSDIVEGTFAASLWEWIGGNFRIDSAIVFDGDATPFPGVDTNPIILNLINDRPAKTLHWVRCKQASTNQLTDATSSDFDGDWSDLDICTRDLGEALKTGLSRPEPNIGEYVEFKQFASVMRGIATGANDFFLMTGEQVKLSQIPEMHFKRCVCRTRDVTVDTVTDELLDELDEKGRPTYLLSLDSRPIEEFGHSVQEYLAQGVEIGLPDRSLLSSRPKWYAMEKRDPVPTFLFAYLGRRKIRFVLNEYGVSPLTGFLCVYPNHDDDEFINALWKTISHPQTVSNLSMVGKSYGKGAIKVEPRQLDKLPITRAVAEETGLIDWWPSS